MTDLPVEGERQGRRRLPWITIAMGTTYVALGAVLAVLLPAQVARIAPDDKVAALAVVASVSFAATLVAQPLIGAWSDRTRSRLGGRMPWMLGGAVVGAMAVGLMAWSTSILVLCILWALGQFALNGVDVTVSSSIVDEFPRGRRGAPSGALAASVAGGAGVGAVIAGTIAASPHLAFLVVAGTALAGAVAFAVASRWVPPVPASPVPLRPGWTAGLAVTRSPDFLWAVAARFGFTLGQQSVSIYLLYIVIDYVGVAEESAPLFVSGLTATGLVALLVGATVSGSVSDRLGRRRPLLIVSSVIFGVGMLVPLLAPSVPGMFVFVAIQGLGLGVHLAVAGALIAEVLPGGDEHAGRDLGLANLVVNLAQSVAPALGGAVVLLTGGYRALFVVAIVAAALSASAAWRVRTVR